MHDSSNSENSRWRRLPLASRLCLAALVIFGGAGSIAAVSFFVDSSDEILRNANRWTAALGLAVATNALYWLFAWDSSSGKKTFKAMLVAVLLISTGCAFYLGLEVVRIRFA